MLGNAVIVESFLSHTVSASASEQSRRLRSSHLHTMCVFCLQCVLLLHCCRHRHRCCVAAALLFLCRLYLSVHINCVVIASFGVRCINARAALSDSSFKQKTATTTTEKSRRNKKETTVRTDGIKIWDDRKSAPRWNAMKRERQSESNMLRDESSSLLFECNECSIRCIRKWY